MIKLKIFILIILFIFFIYYIIDIIIHKLELEYFNNNFKCDTNGELCNKIDFNKDTCCIGYKCMRQAGNFNYKICVNDKDYVPTNVFVPIKTKSATSPGSPTSPTSPGSPASPGSPNLQNNLIPDVSYFARNIFYDLEYNLKKSICKTSN